MRVWRQGRREGEAEIVIKLLARRLGALSTSQEKAVRKLSTRKLEGLAEALLDFSSIDDLTQWMRETKETLNVARSGLRHSW